MRTVTGKNVRCASNRFETNQGHRRLQVYGSVHQWYSPDDQGGKSDGRSLIWLIRMEQVPVLGLNGPLISRTDQQSA
jgi:hypothetical protein